MKKNPEFSVISGNLDNFYYMDRSSLITLNNQSKEVRYVILTFSSVLIATAIYLLVALQMDIVV